MKRNLRDKEWAERSAAKRSPFFVTKISLHMILLTQNITQPIKSLCRDKPHPSIHFNSIGHVKIENAPFQNGLSSQSGLECKGSCFAILGDWDEEVVKANSLTFPPEFFMIPLFFCTCLNMEEYGASEKNQAIKLQNDWAENRNVQVLLIIHWERGSNSKAAKI